MFLLIMNKKILLYILSLFFVDDFINSQTLEIKTGPDNEDKVKVTMGGRIAFDGALYFDDKTTLGNGMTISDVRLTTKMQYKKWDAKIDFGFADKKVNTKDIHLIYNINENSWVKLGYAGEQLGLENWESTAWQKFLTPASSSQVFGSGRQLGLTYVKWNKRIYVSGGFYSDNDALSNSKEGNQGYACVSKFSYDPLSSNGNILHLGISGEYRTGNRDGLDDNNKTKRIMNYSGDLITKVEKKKPLDFTITNVKDQYRFVTELLATTGPIFLLGEYYNLHVNRKKYYHSYNAGGFYIQSGVLIFGDKTYRYNLGDRRLKRPDGKTLEMAVRYDHTDLNDGVYQTEILKGGRMSDVSVALNYYVNKYIGFKLNYSNVNLGVYNNYGNKENINLIQGRVIVVF